MAAHLKDDVDALAAALARDGYVVLPRWLADDLCARAAAEATTRPFEARARTAAALLSPVVVVSASRDDCATRLGNSYDA